MRAVIFDRDGVIIDSESTNIHSAINAFKALGVTITDEEKDWIIGRHPEDYKEIFIKKYRFSYEDFRSIQRNEYYRLLDSTPLFVKTISHSEIAQPGCSACTHNIFWTNRHLAYFKKGRIA